MKELSSQLSHVFNLGVFKPKGKCFSGINTQLSTAGQKTGNVYFAPRLVALSKVLPNGSM